MQFIMIRLPAAVWSPVHITLEGIGREAPLATAFSRPATIARINFAKAAESAGLAATTNRVLARFLCAGGFFSAMLHQFLSAETIQIPEESVLLFFLAVLFLSHGCKLLDCQKYVNANSTCFGYLRYPR